MKAITKIAALSLALFFFATAAIASVTGLAGRINPVSNVIVHQVNISATPDKNLCGNYMIELRNQAGQLVAPPKPFVPGQSRYFFVEKSDMGSMLSTRTASLKNAGNSGTIQCEYTLMAQPSTLKGMFQTGQTYQYELFLKLAGNPKD